MKEKSLSFPFIYFFETGLFNGLRPIQIKKLFSVFRLISGRPKNARPRPPRRGLGLAPIKRKRLTRISGFGNVLHSSLEAVGADPWVPYPYGSYPRCVVAGLDPAMLVFAGQNKLVGSPEWT